MMITMRFMVRQDMDEILDIEDLSFGGERGKWMHDDHERFACGHNCWTIVAFWGDTVLGIVCFTLHVDSVEVVRVVVHPRMRRRGVATALLHQIEQRIKGRRERAWMNVPEQALECQLFLREQGWRARGVVYDNCILFELSMAILGGQVIQRILEGNDKVMQVV